MNWLTTHWPEISVIAYGVLSEVLAIRQTLKYPANDGVGGVIAALLKFLTPPAPKA